MPRHLEHQFQAAAHTFLCRALPGALHWGVDHAGARSPIQGARMKQRGIIAGIADHFTLYRGVLIAWEWKAGKNETSDHQNAFGARVNANHGYYIVARTLEEIERGIRRMGWEPMATNQGLDAKLAARTPAKKPRKARVEKPSTSQINRIERLRGKVMF